MFSRGTESKKLNWNLYFQSHYKKYFCNSKEAWKIRCVTKIRTNFKINHRTISKTNITQNENGLEMDYLWFQELNGITKMKKGVCNWENDLGAQVYKQGTKCNKTKNWPSGPDVAMWHALTLGKLQELDKGRNVRAGASFVAVSVPVKLSPKVISWPTTQQDNTIYIYSALLHEYASPVKILQPFCDFVPAMSKRINHEITNRDQKKKNFAYSNQEWINKNSLTLTCKRWQYCTQWNCLFRSEEMVGKFFPNSGDYWLTRGPWTWFCKHRQCIWLSLCF